MQTPPPINAPAQAPLLRASKWTCIQVLLGQDELLALLEHLQNPSIYLCGTLWSKESFPEHKKLFLENHQHYIQTLSQGNLPDPSLSRTYFSACMTETNAATYIQDVQNGQFLLRITEPIIQLQHHTMSFSPHDGKMHSMVFGKDAITWGFQLSYPQMYLDKNGQVQQTHEGSHHPNSQLFKTLQRWLRHNTLPTTFLADGQRTATAIRLGKTCTPWIQHHPQLQAQNIQVVL